MDDLISRALALEVINAVKGVTWSQSGKVLCGKMFSQIKDLPAVDAVPVVHGRWVDVDGNPVAWSKALLSYPEDSCVCSVCDTWLVGSDELPVYGLYCPACGAKMDGERRESE